MRKHHTWRYLLVGALGLLWLAPIYLLIVNASKTSDAYSNSSNWAVSGPFALFQNMASIWTQGQLGVAIGPTVEYSIIASIIGVLVGAAAGYGIMTLKLKHGFAWFVVIFGGTIIPMQMVLMPLFVAYARTGAYDTQWGMILVYVAGTVPGATFVMRNFFTGIASNVFEAATLDGAGTVRIFFTMYIPMAKSALIAVFLMQIVIIWNDLLFGLTLSQSVGVRPLMPSLTALNSAYGGATMPALLAGGLMVSLPTVFMYLFSQRVFARGLTLGQY